jgi:hypothetical protein
MSTSIRQELNETRRKKYLHDLINEAIVQLLSEQEAPAAPAGMPAPMTPPADVSAPSAPEEQPKEFTVDDMIERLNVIRGGRSFTDPEVYGQLVTFFKKQTDEQKQAIETFLVEIGKIVINVNEQEAAPEASAVPPATPAAQPAMPPAPAAPATPPTA